MTNSLAEELMAMQRKLVVFSDFQRYVIVVPNTEYFKTPGALAGIAEFEKAWDVDIVYAGYIPPLQRSKRLNQFIEYTEFVKSMKVFPEKHAIVYPALGMVGEAGEVTEKIKKWLRGDRELDKAELIKEIGDVLWYVTALADDLGYTLEDVARMNVEKLSSRRERGVVKGDGDNR